ncbi:MAG TPA: ankyrin repeat domain-containing protein [Burkholderiales bacterium]|nr:ankyrin repeat domain-containing protein [Burkholderiales bacterium]
MIRFFRTLLGLGFFVVMSSHAALPDPARFGASIEAGDLHSARAWLDEGLPADFAADRIGTGLMIAAWEGNVEMMALFHSRGADVNYVNAQGEQALMHAAWKGHIDAVRWLLAHGAQVNRAPRQWTALHYAVFAGNEEAAQLLMQQGADINARSTNGSTVLMMAAREGRASLAQALINRGAEAGVRNDAGDSALQWSLRHGHMQIARALATAEQIAAETKVAVNLPPPKRSEPAPKKIESLLEDIRAARAAGKPIDEVMRAYTAALAEFNRKPAVRKGTARGMVITAKRNAPEQQRATLVYDAGNTPPLSRMVEEIRAARASGGSVNEVLKANEAALSSYRDKGSDAP